MSTHSRSVKYFPVRDHYGDYTIDSVNDALYEDIHALLLRLREWDFDIWEALEELLYYYLNAVEIFGSEVSEEEQKHAFDAYRCVCACVIENNILQEFRAAGDSILSSLLADDHDFRLVYAFWRWCTDYARTITGFSELASQAENINELVSSARSNMEGTTNGSETADTLKAALGPDFEKLTRTVFSLIRCRRYEDAMTLSGTISVPWMKFLIRTQCALRGSSPLGIDLTEGEKDLLRTGIQSFQIMKECMAETNYTTGMRMVFASLLGDLEYLLPLATNIEDRLWCYANAAVQARINRALGIDYPVLTPTTVDGIFEAVITVDTSPYYILMTYMMRGSWNEAIKWMYVYCKNLDDTTGVNLSPLHRFFGLVVSVCSILKYEHDKIFAKDLLSRMIDAMLQKQLFCLTPFYASLLPKDDALTKIWSIMSYVEESYREDFIRAMNDAGFDGDDLAVRFGRFRA